MIDSIIGGLRNVQRYGVRFAAHQVLAKAYSNIRKATIAKEYLKSKRRLHTKGSLSVHYLCCKRDLLMAICAIYSLAEAVGDDLSINIHDDGSLDDQSIATLLRYFPEANVYRRRHSDDLVEPMLKDFAHLRYVRQTCFMFRKLVDPLVLGKGRYRLVVDTDVLFFRKPKELLDEIERGKGYNWYNRDIRSNYSILKSEAQDSGPAVLDNINAGLGLLFVDNFPLGLLDQLGRKIDIATNPWVAEQTMHGLVGGLGCSRLLPESYELNYHWRPSGGAVSKHYVGAISDGFFLAGVKRLLRT